MSGFEVKAVVSSLVEAFHSGLEVFRRMKERHSKKSTSTHAATRFSREDAQLRHSLRSRPLEVSTVYDKNVAQFGDLFASGDGIAQASLAHILLVLNTGLMNVICAATSDESGEREFSRRLLFQLSERAGRDAVGALNEFRQRLSSNPRLTGPDKNTSMAMSSSNRPRVDNLSQHKASGSKGRKCPSAVKKRGPKPRRSATVRIAWVRPKDRPSNPPKDLRNPKSPHLTHQGQSFPSPATCERPARPEAKRAVSAPLGSSANIRNPKALSLPEADRSLSKRQQSTPNLFIPNRKPVPSPSPPKSPPVPPKEPLPQIIYPPPVPPKIPQTSPPNYEITMARSTRHRPISTYSFQTDSTKIGEIPEHRLPQSALTYGDWNQDPYAGMVSAQELKRRKGNPLLFWRRRKDNS